MSLILTPPAGPWTVDDLQRIPDSGYRFEIHEGNLVMMSSARQWHNDVEFYLRLVLVELGYVVGTEVGLRRASNDVRTPDLAIFHDEPKDRPNRAFFEAKELSVVIEVESESSLEDDRVLKPKWYAALGIPEYWRVEETDSGEALVHLYRLVDPTNAKPHYRHVGRTTLTELQHQAERSR